jgi:hypothetical protein
MIFDYLLVNGDSYSAEINGQKAYAHHLANRFNLPYNNISVVGSNNDRILRTTIEKVIELKQQGKKLLVVIGWSFVHRIEVWYHGNHPLVLEKIPDPVPGRPEHAQSKLITLDHVINHGDASLEHKSMLVDQRYAHKQIVDFYTKIYLLSEFFNGHSVDYFFFAAADHENYNVNSFPFISDLNLVKNVLENHKIDLSGFSIPAWAKKHDSAANPNTGHLSNQGHKEFGDFLYSLISNR